MIKHLNLINKKGDTIVEVLIALTILSLAMSISYATANSSIRGLQSARSTARATSLMQKQIEYIRINNPGATDFCYSATGIIRSYTPPSFSADCIQDGYTIKVKKSNLSAPFEYNLVTTWSVGDKQYTSTMKYVY